LGGRAGACLENIQAGPYLIKTLEHLGGNVFSQHLLRKEMGMGGELDGGGGVAELDSKLRTDDSTEGGFRTLLTKVTEEGKRKAPGVTQDLECRQQTRMGRNEGRFYLQALKRRGTGRKELGIRLLGEECS